MTQGTRVLWAAARHCSPHLRQPSGLYSGARVMLPGMERERETPAIPPSTNSGAS